MSRADNDGRNFCRDCWTLNARPVGEGWAAASGSGDVTISESEPTEAANRSEEVVAEEEEEEEDSGLRRKGADKEFANRLGKKILSEE